MVEWAPVAAGGCDPAALAPRAARALTAAGPFDRRPGRDGMRVDRERTGSTSLPTGPYVDWYEAWRAQHGRRAAAEAAARARWERQLRWIIRGFVGWAALVTAATFASIWWLVR